MGLMVSEKIFLKCFLILNQSMASIDTRSVDGKNYVGDYKA